MDFFRDDNKIKLALEHIGSIKFCREGGDAAWLLSNGIDVSSGDKSSGDVSDICRVPDSTRRVIAYAVFQDNIVLTYQGEMMSVRELVQKYRYRWLRGSGPGIFAMVVGPMNGDAGAAIPSPTLPVTRVVYLVCEVTGPNVSDVRLQEVAGPHEGEIYECMLAKHIVKFERVQHPGSFSQSLRYKILQTMWQRSWQPENLSSSEYYARSLTAYSSWSVKFHQQQLSALLKNISVQSLLIAPGDGLATVKSMFKGETISGDKYASVRGVEKEEISDTILRGIRHPNRNKVLVLSYVTSFMTDDDWRLVDALQCPVFILDSKIVTPPLTGQYHVLGEGFVSVRADPQPWFSDRKERIDYTKTVRYSENLLKIDDPSIERVSDSVLYMNQMLPLQTFECRNQEVFSMCKSLGFSCVQGRDGTPIFETLKDLVHGGGRGYLCSIGRIVTEIEEIGAPLRKLASRTVYRARVTEVWRKILSLLSTYEFEGYVYFAWFLDTDANLPYDFSDEGSSWKGSLIFQVQPFIDPQSLQRDGLLIRVGHRAFQMRKRDLAEARIFFSVAELKGSKFRQALEWFELGDEDRNLLRREVEKPNFINGVRKKYKGSAEHVATVGGGKNIRTYWSAWFPKEFIT